MGEYAKRGGEVQAEFGGSQNGQTVPTDLTGKSLDYAKQILDKDGIQYTIVSDPNDPQDPNKAPNTVTRVDPHEGQPLPQGQPVTLYVTNSQESGSPTPVPVVTSTPTVVENPAPTPTPTPIPTPKPKPKPTPKPLPTPHPTPKRQTTKRTFPSE